MRLNSALIVYKINNTYINFVCQYISCQLNCAQFEAIYLKADRRLSQTAALGARSHSSQYSWLLAPRF